MKFKQPNRSINRFHVSFDTLLSVSSLTRARSTVFNFKFRVQSSFVVCKRVTHCELALPYAPLRGSWKNLKLCCNFFFFPISGLFPQLLSTEKPCKSLRIDPRQELAIISGYTVSTLLFPPFLCNWRLLLMPATRSGDKYRLQLIHMLSWWR